MHLVYYLIRWVVAALALMITAYVVPGFKVRDFSAALIAAIVIGIANVLIWPFLMVITLPLNLITLGLFTFVVNGIVLKLCAAVLEGFKIDGWLSAIFGAIILSLSQTFLHYLLL